MSKKHPWLCAGTAALALVFNQRAVLPDEPPREEEVEVEVTESVQQVAQKAAEAAKAIAAEAAAEAQERAAKIAADAAQQAREAAEEVVKEVTKVAGEAAKKARLTGTLNIKPAPYQIGLQVAPVSKALEAQLKLEGKGILIDVVEKDGPGEKAGLKPHDIVIMVDEQEVKSSADLSKTLANSEGKELKFDVIRGGEKVTIEVQPRSTGQLNLNVLNGTINLDSPKIEIDEEIIKLESKIREKLKGAGVDVRMHVIRPGQVMRDDVLLKRAELPEGVSISVRKEGGKPAKIEVSRGDERWEVTEESLDKLPEDLKPHVERMLGRGPRPFAAQGIYAAFPAVPAIGPNAPDQPFTFAIGTEDDVQRRIAVAAKHNNNRTEYEAIEKQLKHIRDDIKRLYDQIEELREDRQKD